MGKAAFSEDTNVYWVRVSDKVRDIVDKTQLTKNLSATDLAEANMKKHKVIAELKQLIHLAEQKLDGTFASLSKDDQLRKLALRVFNVQKNICPLVSSYVEVFMKIMVDSS